MSKKDYQAIARVLYQTRQDVRDVNPQHLSPRELADWAIGNIASRVSDAMAADNPRFDRARFLAACETGGAK